MAGRDFSSELFGSAANASGRDFSYELFGDAAPTSDQPRKKTAKDIADSLGSVDQFKRPKVSMQDIVNFAGGGVSTGESIGKAIGLGESDRLKNAGVDSNSDEYKAGRLMASVLQSLFAGRLVGEGARLLGAAPHAVKALETFGMQTGRKTAGASQWAANQLLRTGAGATSGAASALLTDPDNIQNAAGFGAIAPAALGSLGWAATKTFNGGRNLFAGSKAQAQNYLDDVFGGHEERLKVARQLEELKSGVKGEMPTAGKAAVSGKYPIPELKALEEGARSRPAAAKIFAEIDAKNEAARINPLEEMAHKGRQYFNPETRKVEPSELEALRIRVTQPMYARANKDMVQVSPELEAALMAGQAKTPSVSSMMGIDQARANMAAGGRPTSAGVVREGYTPKPFAPPLVFSESTILDDYLKALPGTGSPFIPQNRSYSIETLQRFKGDITQKIATLSKATDAPAQIELSQLKETRRLLTQAMKEQSGNYAAANQISRNYFQGENQAKVADSLLKAIVSPGGKERPDAYLSAMADSLKTIGRAGVHEVKDIREVMTPDQMRYTFGPLTRSLQQESKYNALKAPQTILPEVKSTIDVIEKFVPRFLNNVVVATRSGLSRVGGILDKDSQIVVDSLMSDPKKLAAFISQKTPKEQGQITQYIAAKIAPNIGAATSGIFNAEQSSKQPGLLGNQ